MKKILSVVIAIVMLLSVFPQGVLFVSAEGATSGTTGSCTWVYDSETKTLTISGEGVMGTAAPWSGLNILNIVVENGVTQVYAFGGTAVKTVSLGSTVTLIGDNAFKNCTSLKEITLPDSVTTIGASAFEGDNVLKTVNVGSGLKTIGNRAFYECTALETINLPSGLTGIGEYAFYNCYTMKSLEVPGTVKTISDYAFYKCAGLNSIVLHEGINNIGMYAFGYCRNVKYIDLPSSIKSINYYAFYGCSSLRSFVIPEGVTEIRGGTFCGCESLKTITIPYTVTSIRNNGYGLIDGCTSLTDVYFTGDEDEWKRITGRGDILNDNITLHYEISAPADHTFGEWETVREATCTTSGLQIRVCDDCGYTEEQEIPVLGHNYNAVTVAPTCTAQGYTTHTCTRCGDTYNDTLIPAAGHNYEGWSFTASTHWQICCVCGARSQAAVHIYDDDQDASCNVCGFEREVTPPVHQHNYSANWLSNNTQHWHACSECGEKADFANHVFDSDSDTICNICGYTRTVTPLAPQIDTKITVESKKALTGKQITLSVDLSNNPGLAYLKLALDYDENSFELVSAVNAQLLAGTYTTSRTIEVKPYVLQWMGADNSTDSGELVVLTFNVKEDAVLGEHTISINVVEAYNSAYEDVEIAVENGIVNVRNVIIGDFNGDEVINGKDGILCSQALAGWDIAYSELAADVNGDGKFNGKDGILLSQYLAGWDVVLG